VNNITDIINTKENRQLLFKYLSKFYGSDKAKELMIKHKDNLFGFNGLAYSVGKRSIEFFCIFFLQDVFTPKPDNEAAELGDFHYELWKQLEDMYVKDEYDKFLAVLPRGSSKSTTCDYALSVWAHCYKYSIYTLVAGNTEQDAVQFISQARMTFEENPYIIHTFGELVNSRKHTVNKLELELANRTKIQAISSTGSMRGKKYTIGSNAVRPTLVIADDFQSKSDILTLESRDKKYNTYMEDVKFIGSRSMERDDGKKKMSTKFVTLGTILHRNCLISRLMENPTYRKFVRKGILLDDIDKYFNTGLWAEFKRILFNPKDQNALDNAKEFYYQNEKEMKYPVLWSSYWSCLELALDYFENPQGFKQEVMNDASKIGEKAFHQISKLSREEIEQQEFTKTILCCDPAVETKAHNDYTALLVGSLTPNNFRWVRKGLIKRLTFDEYTKHVIDLLKEYKDITHIWIEKNTYNGADQREIEKLISKDQELSQRKITIINERQHKNKEAKIRAISGKVDSGFFVFAEEDKEFTDQILAYEGEKFSAFDDAPDITAEFDRLIDEIIVNKDITSVPRGWFF
jgi:predicted phage terminase large subunit-like protein